jgi:predicted DNA-binding transcriptional regulator AlpA
MRLGEASRSNKKGHVTMTEKKLIPDPQVCRRYGVSGMTIWRWDRNPELNFPKPIRINRRKYRDEAELESWERERAAQRDGCEAA